MNMYAYVGNDPMNKNDPFGRNGVAVTAARACAANPVCVGTVATGGAIASTAILVGTSRSRNHINRNRFISASVPPPPGTPPTASEDTAEIGHNGGPPLDDPNPQREPEMPPNLPGPPFIPEFTQHGEQRSDERGVPGLVVGDTLLDPSGVSVPGRDDTTVFL